MEKAETSYNMFDWWKKVVLKNYANFQGRARRSEYWYYVLTNFIFLMGIYFIAAISVFSGSLLSLIFTVIIYGVMLFGLVIPGLAVTVRRLHDIGKSGWNYFFVLIPFGIIVLLIWLCTEGQSGDNQYGSDPKAIQHPDFDFEQRG